MTRAISRRRRLARLRATALPSFFEQVNPTRIAAGSASSGWRCRAWRRKPGIPCRRPCAARRKSARFVSVRQTETAGGVSVPRPIWPCTGASGGVMPCAWLSALRPTGPSGLWRGARPEPCGRPWSPCAHGSRGDGRGRGSTVGRCASSRQLRFRAAQTATDSKAAVIRSPALRRPRGPSQLALARNSAFRTTRRQAARRPWHGGWFNSPRRMIILGSTAAGQRPAKLPWLGGRDLTIEALQHAFGPVPSPDDALRHARRSADLRPVGRARPRGLQPVAPRTGTDRLARAPRHRRDDRREPRTRTPRECRGLQRRPPARRGPPTRALLAHSRADLEELRPAGGLRLRTHP